MNRTVDPVRAVADALRRAATTIDCEVAIVAGDAVDWWSATFAGHRVALTIELPATAAADAWLHSLPDAELPLAGRIVADCAIGPSHTVGDGRLVKVSLLLIDLA